jgi:hypothetical protein
VSRHVGGAPSKSSAPWPADVTDQRKNDAIAALERARHALLFGPTRVHYPRSREDTMVTISPPPARANRIGRTSPPNGSDDDTEPKVGLRGSFRVASDAYPPLKILRLGSRSPSGDPVEIDVDFANR